MILLAFGVAASIVMVADSYVKQVIADVSVAHDMSG
jgi:hypothetical protein